jgi:hypothetical protein
MQVLVHESQRFVNYAGQVLSVLMAEFPMACFGNEHGETDQEKALSERRKTTTAEKYFQEGSLAPLAGRNRTLGHCVFAPGFVAG